MAFGKIFLAGSPGRARWSYLTRLGLPAVSRKKNFPKSHIINPLLTKFAWSRWLDIGLVLFCEFIDLDYVSVHKHAKIELGQYPANLTSHLVNNPYILTEQAWSIKDLLYGFHGNFSCRMRRVIQSEQDGSILLAWVPNHSAGFDSSCPLAELAI